MPQSVSQINDKPDIALIKDADAEKEKKIFKPTATKKQFVSKHNLPFSLST